MRYLYGAADEKFIKGIVEEKDTEPLDPLDSYKFQVHIFLRGKSKFDKNDVPIQFKTTPDTLLTLASIICDAIPLVSIYSWNNWHICLWLRQIGYPQYQVELFIFDICNIFLNFNCFSEPFKII